MMQIPRNEKIKGNCIKSVTYFLKGKVHRHIFRLRGKSLISDFVLKSDDYSRILKKCRTKAKWK
jgi:hypothetical protein